MEKFGVETDASDKQASEGKRDTCPRCSKALLPPDDSNVPRCPTCGTLPFESR